MDIQFGDVNTLHHSSSSPSPSPMKRKNLRAN